MTWKKLHGTVLCYYWLFFYVLKQKQSDFYETGESLLPTFLQFSGYL